MHTLVKVGAVVALLVGLAGCGSDDDPGDADPSRGATSSDGGSTDAPDDSDDSDGGSGDCATPEQAAQFSINGQIVSQFANLPTERWSTTLGNLDDLDEEVAALSSLEGADVEAAIAIYEQIPPIIEAGLGGDTAATAKLADLIGTDPVEALKLKNTIVLAYAKQCQGAG
ncbi:hypothetical protein [Nocardioides sp. WS12]|uniref:hypothetical protein n=1 Tax=Nocardioides sp. WS12 TaxID=2486272 RepID=UPI0015F9C3B5|nr:hypothetical protein [Nocardioides sp. WS12]